MAHCAVLDDEVKAGETIIGDSNLGNIGYPIKAHFSVLTQGISVQDLRKRC